MLASIVLSASFFRSEWKERRTIEEDDLQWIIEKDRSDMILIHSPSKHKYSRHEIC